jgi:diguanylate cyclase (GGDEF)-like protein
VPDPGPAALARAALGAAAGPEAEETLRALFGALEAGILIVAPDDQVVYANQAFRSFFSIPEEYFEGGPTLADALHKWFSIEGIDAEEAERVLAEVGARRPYLRRVERESHSYLIQSVPLPSRAIAMVLFDTTAERDYRDRVEEGDRLLRVVMDAAPCFIAYLDKELRFVLANEYHAPEFGASTRDIEGKDFREVYSPELAARREPLFRRCLEGQEVRFYDRGPSESSPIKDVFGMYVPVRGKGGEVEGIVGVTVDNTLQRDLERRLEEKNLELAEAIRELEEANRELHLLATTDSLSGALNRPAIFAELGEALRRAARYGRPLAIVLFDLDLFKLVNDERGHAAGDEAIRRFGEVCMRAFRSTDHFGRYGGEEFLAVLPEVDLAGAVEAAERARRDIAEAELRSASSGPFRITVSAGVAAWEGGLDADAFVARADQALYAAKRGGRNRVEAYRPAR